MSYLEHQHRCALLHVKPLSYAAFLRIRDAAQ